MTADSFPARIVRSFVRLAGRRAVVTGAAGFVGSNLVRALVAAGVDVHGIGRETTDRQRLRNVGRSFVWHNADLRRPEPLRGILRTLRPDTVVHTAISGVHPDRRDRGEMLASNILGSHHLIEALRGSDHLERLIVTGGSSEYGRKDVPMRESDLLEPTTFYGASKAASTLFFQQAAREFALPVVILRLFSVYGYAEPEHRLIPTAFRAARGKQRLPMTAPGFRRDFVFIEDVVEACLRAVEADLPPGEILNIGSGRQTANEEVVAIIDRLTGGGLEIDVGAYEAHTSDTRFWCADIHKAERLLGWTPRHTLLKGLEKTRRWLDHVR